ncbi:unnamed protein product [Anisakis simplex]|uniref:85/88 kDa calcium-independent phospholipase A2 (inferred by orthology to a human protein) n=1 Tax=Anisakis simplex TaxID=6269 RepID=A0A0M3K662_ANISI|nr:unnamed protein product [Anisakis simplex]
MFNLIRNVASYAAPENYQAIANVYNRVAEAFTPSSSKVEKISASKLNSLAKCDSSMVFSIYSERTASPIFYVIYLPRMLIVFRSQVKADADLIRSSFSNLSKLINALENHSESDFVSRMDRLRKSVEENPSFGVIHHASACDFADAITKICSQSDAQVVVNEASIDGRFPLQIAAEESLRVLIRFGADLSKQDSKLRNVLHYAAEKSPKVLQVSVAIIMSTSDRFEIAMNQIDEDGMTPLCKAIQASQIDSVKLLLDSGCSKGPFPAGPIAAILTLADNSSNRLPELVDTIAKRCPNFLFERIHGTSTILHEEMDKALLYHILEGVGQTLDVNVRDGLKQTPLHCAVRRGSLEQTIALLAFGCDVNAVDEDGDTALHIAIQVCTLDYGSLLHTILIIHSWILK